MVYPLVSPLANLCVLVGSYSCKKDRATTLKVGEILLGAYTDLDALVGCDSSFLIGAWIASAKKWAHASDAPENYYEWMARSQVSTWWPVAPSDAAKQTSNYTKGPPLDGCACCFIVVPPVAVCVYCSLAPRPSVL